MACICQCCIICCLLLLVFHQLFSAFLLACCHCYLMVLLDLSVLLALAWLVSVASAGSLVNFFKFQLVGLCAGLSLHDQGGVVRACVRVFWGVVRVLACVSGLALLPHGLSCMVKFSAWSSFAVPVLWVCAIVWLASAGSSWTWLD